MCLIKFGKMGIPEKRENKGSALFTFLKGQELQTQNYTFQMGAWTEENKTFLWFKNHSSNLLFLSQKDPSLKFSKNKHG